jgi:hypothetical protein
MENSIMLTGRKKNLNFQTNSCYNCFNTCHFMRQTMNDFGMVFPECFKRLEMSQCDKTVKTGIDKLEFVNNKLLEFSKIMLSYRTLTLSANFKGTAFCCIVHIQKEDFFWKRFKRCLNTYIGRTSVF